MVGGYVLPFGKGQREFLQAAARIHQRVPRARFLIIGRGNMGDLLRQDIPRLGLPDQAWLTPYCTDMLLAMNALDCLVHSQIGTEAMPGVVCEAQACGRPVIASDLDGIPEAVAIGSIGRLVKPGSVEELAAAMLQQGSEDRLPDPARHRMHQRVGEAFSLPVSARRLLSSPPDADAYPDGALEAGNQVINPRAITTSKIRTNPPKKVTPFAQRHRQITPRPMTANKSESKTIGTRVRRLS